MLASDLEHISNEEARKYFLDRQEKRSSKKEVTMAQHKRKGTRAKLARQERAQARIEQTVAYHEKQLQRLNIEIGWFTNGSSEWHRKNNAIEYHAIALVELKRN